MNEWTPHSLSSFVVDRVPFGIFAVDESMGVVLWNRFMQRHSGRGSENVVGRNLFDCFPELPRSWLEKKIQSVFLLKNFSFTSWEYRPYLFRFMHDRPITGGVESMQQDCTFMPLVTDSGKVEAVCVTIVDATDVCLVRRDLKDVLIALEESASRDGLTGVYNRRQLDDRLSAEFQRYRRFGGEFSLLMLDLDQFKEVNDRHGHLAGDAVLRAVAFRVAQTIRSVDIFGRYGGEEFAVILPGTGVSPALVIAEKIRRTIGETPVEFDAMSLTVTVSIGATAIRRDVPTYEALIGEADSAMYKAKAQGRNRCVRFKPPAV